MRRPRLVLLTAALLPALLAPLPLAAAAEPSGPVAAGGTQTIAFAGSGDGGPAVEALVSARSASVDPAGNAYLLEDLQVRRVDAASGVITTVAGSVHRGVPADGLAPLGPLLSGRPTERATATPTGQVHLLAEGQLWRVEDGKLRRVASGEFGDLDAGPDGSVYVTGAGRSPGISVLAPGSSSLTRLTADSFTAVRVGADGRVYGRNTGISRVTAQGRSASLEAAAQQRQRGPGRSTST